MDTSVTDAYIVGAYMKYTVNDGKNIVNDDYELS